MTEQRGRRDRIVEWATRAAAEENPAEPAATVVLVRDGASGGVETLMVRKDSKVAFGGMWVFPGGRIDPGDLDAAGADEFEAARRAAAREAEEEAGLAVDHHALEALSFWIPPAQTPRRFATWFFVAPAPEGQVVVDDGEIREHRWLSPTAALDLRDRGEIELAPPTWVTLRWLARHDGAAQCLQAARDTEPERFETRIALAGDGAVALWEADAGYEASDLDAPGPRHRLWLRESGWHYERSD